ncbi:MAG: hypothetical protein ACFB6R_18285 [Alphaproteobacteria bacterium]
MESRITARDLVRAVLVVAGAVAQVTFAFAPDLLGFERSIGGLSQEFQTLLVPAGFVFAIWLPLYGGSIAFAVFHALPAQLRDPLFRSVGWLAALSFLANAAWAIHQPLFGPGWVSFALILAIVAPLLVAIGVVRRAGRLRFWRNLALAPLFGLAGWITLASPVAFSLALRLSGLEPDRVSEMTLALTILAVWALIAGLLIWRARSIVFTAAILWGLAGVAVINEARGVDLLSMAAVLSGGLLLVLALGAKFRVGWA